MDFIEIKKHKELVEAYEVIKELIPELDKGDFLKSVNHELLKNHKLFGLKSSGKLVSVAAVWLFLKCSPTSLEKGFNNRRRRGYAHIGLYRM